MELKALYSKLRHTLEDPWRRRLNQSLLSSRVEVFGHPVELSSNSENILKSLRISKDFFTQAPKLTDQPFRIEIISSDGPDNPGPIPENLFNHINYTGGSSWLNLQFANWGNCFINLEICQATAVISEAFAVRPDLISRCMLNTIITNFFIASGYGMLHATCLVKDKQVLLLMAPHGSGKSTTALSLFLAGYSILTDSMVFLNRVDNHVQFNGFPTGRIKLRKDMLENFPQLKPYLERELVRDEVKFIVNLYELNRDFVINEALSPSNIHLCLLSLTGTNKTELEAIDTTTVLNAIMENSLYFDSEEIWLNNLAQIETGLSTARAYRLAVGTDEKKLLQIIERLLADNYSNQ